mgnify:CR=1 FL=1
MITLFRRRIRQSSINFKPGDLGKLTNKYKSEYKTMLEDIKATKRKDREDKTHQEDI